MDKNIATLIRGMPGAFYAADGTGGSTAQRIVPIPAYSALPRDSYINPRPQNGDASGDGFLHIPIELPDDTDLPAVQKYLDIRL